jgi:uncharacterized protein YcbX
MTLVGTIEEIWVYPLSSLGGEKLSSSKLTARGIPGDRAWCIVDAQTGTPASPETDQRWRPALFLRARTGEGLPRIGFRDGEWLAVDDDRLKPRLDEHFSFAVDVRRYGSDAHGAEVTAAHRYEPSPVHLLTTSSFENLSNMMDSLPLDIRRFRPTILVRTSVDPDFVESNWLGRNLRIGSALLRATEETRRCVMTFIAQPGLDEDPNILSEFERQ